LSRACNLGTDPEAYLKTLPSAAIREFHLAGHSSNEIDELTVLIDDHASCVSHRWKQFVLLCAFPVAVLANIGIYACMDATAIQTPGTACYIIVAIAAVADWTYAVVDVAFVLNLAYDIYHHDHFEAARGVDAKSVSDVSRLLSMGEV